MSLSVRISAAAHLPQRVTTEGWLYAVINVLDASSNETHQERGRSFRKGKAFHEVPLNRSNAVAADVLSLFHRDGVKYCGINLEVEMSQIITITSLHLSSF